MNRGGELSATSNRNFPESSTTGYCGLWRVLRSAKRAPRICVTVVCTLVQLCNESTKHPYNITAPSDTHTHTRRHCSCTLKDGEQASHAHILLRLLTARVPAEWTAAADPDTVTTASVQCRPSQRFSLQNHHCAIDLARSRSRHPANKGASNILLTATPQARRAASRT